MSDYIKLTTVTEVRAAIKKAKNVWMNVRLGTIERVVELKKNAALEMMKGLDGKMSAEFMECYGSAIAETSPDGYSIWIN